MQKNGYFIILYFPILTSGSLTITTLGTKEQEDYKKIIAENKLEMERLHDKIKSLSAQVEDLQQGNLYLTIIFLSQITWLKIKLKLICTT